MRENPKCPLPWKTEKKSGLPSVPPLDMMKQMLITIQTEGLRMHICIPQYYQEWVSDSFYPLGGDSWCKEEIPDVNFLFYLFIHFFNRTLQEIISKMWNNDYIPRNFSSADCSCVLQGWVNKLTDDIPQRVWCNSQATQCKPFTNCDVKIHFYGPIHRTVKSIQSCIFQVVCECVFVCQSLDCFSHQESKYIHVIKLIFVIINLWKR